MTQGTTNTLVATTGHGLALAAEFFLPFIIVGWIAVVFCSHDQLVQVAKTDRAIQRLESFPVLWFPWGAYAGRAEIPEPHPIVPDVKPDNRSDTIGATGGLINTYVNRHVGNLKAFAAIAIPRAEILVGILPPFLALLWAAWGYGRAKYTMSVKDGQRLSPRMYDWSLRGLWLSFGVIICLLGVPFPISSWLHMLPMATALWCMSLVGTYRA